MPTDKARVFFALWPDDAVRTALAAAADAAESECGGRATAREKIHLTLFFVGSVERSRLPQIEQCAAAVAGSPFSLDMDTLGHWRHNRIVWAGTRARPAALPRLVAELARNLAEEGIHGEVRPYVPHVTLVRNARRAPSGKAIEAPRWDVRELVLVESAPAQRGVRYDIISRFALTG